MSTKHQALNKLHLLAEQLAAHAKKHGIQCFAIYEVKDGQVGIQQHCTEELLVNLAAHLGMNHIDAIHRANAILKKLNGIEQGLKAEKKKDSILIGLDGKPMAAEA